MATSKRVIEAVAPLTAEGPSRFSHYDARSPMKWGVKDIDMQLWTADGSSGTTYVADTGTDARQQHPTHLFDDSSDDNMYTRFITPTDYNPEIGKMYVGFLFYCSGDHDATHMMRFGGNARLIPVVESHTASTDNSESVVLDGAGTSLGSVDAYLDDTVSEIKSFELEITAGVSPQKFDFIQLEINNINSPSTTTGSVYVCGSYIRYSR